MSKDDYFVIICRVLAYLYECLKNGEAPSSEYLTYGTDAFPINQRYWTYIMKNLQLSGYIDGVAIVSITGSIKDVKLTENLEITPLGIEYLQNNSTIEKAKKFLKTLKEICPGL